MVAAGCRVGVARRDAPAASGHRPDVPTRREQLGAMKLRTSAPPRSDAQSGTLDAARRDATDSVTVPGGRDSLVTAPERGELRSAPLP